MNAFGKQSDYLTKYDVSRLLLDHVVRRMRQTRDATIPTQDAIARELGVSQSMVSGVINGRKYFGRGTFAVYAKNQGISEAELLAMLLAVSSDGATEESIDLLERSCGEARMVTNRVLDAWARLDSERAISMTDTGHPFDADRAYQEILLALIGTLQRLGIAITGAGLVATIGDEMTVHAAPAEARSSADCRFVDRLKPTTMWNKMLRETLQPRLYRGNVELTPGIVVRCDAKLSREPATKILLGIDCDGSSPDRSEYLALFPVFDDSSACESGRGSRVGLAVIGAQPDLGDRFCEIVSLFSRLAERVALHAVQERLLCAEVALGGDLAFAAILSTTCHRKRSWEHLEAGVGEFLRAICHDPGMYRKVAAADAWILDVTARKFISPSDHFRCISKSRGEHWVKNDTGQEDEYGKLYEQQFSSLRPRLCGSTAYIVATRCGFIINGVSGNSASTALSGATELNPGTYIGIPTLMQPKYQSDRGFVGLVSLRCRKKLDLQRGLELVERACELMCDTKVCRLTPLLSQEGWQENRVFAKGINGLFGKLVVRNCMRHSGYLAAEVVLEAKPPAKRDRKKLRQKSANRVNKTLFKEP